MLRSKPYIDGPDSEDFEGMAMPMDTPPYDSADMTEELAEYLLKISGRMGDLQRENARLTAQVEELKRQIKKEGA